MLHELLNSPFWLLVIAWGFSIGGLLMFRANANAKQKRVREEIAREFDDAKAADLQRRRPQLVFTAVKGVQATQPDEAA